jgi:putative spermidine/putrescine transport system permease protein
MKNWRNELFAWLLMLSGLGTILPLMGSTFYVVIAQSLGWFNLEGDSHFSPSTGATCCRTRYCKAPCSTP